MRRHMRALQRVSCSAVIALSVVVAAAPGLAQTQQHFPGKPVRLVVPFSPGGTSDILGRMISPKMSESWGQPVVVETRTGAGGTIGASIVAKAAPDGHTLLLTSAAFAISAALNANLPYDARKDFAGITRIGYSTTALVVSPNLGVKSVREFIMLAQAKPGKIFFSSAGAGSATHMNGERFRLAADIKVVHVGFKGASDATLEVLAERVHYCIVGLAGALPFIKDGRLLALAVGMPQRSPLLPEVPTIAETLPGYERDGSHSLLAPAGTPPHVLKKINKEIRRVFELPDIKERLQNFDFVFVPTTPEEHERVLRADIETFSKVVRLAGLIPK